MDRGDAPDAPCTSLHVQGCEPFVPSPTSRGELLPPDDDPLYKARRLVDNCFERLKESRRMATRYENPAACAPISFPSAVSSSCLRF